MNSKTIILGVVIAVVLVGAIVGVQYFAGGTKAAKGTGACAYDDCNWTGPFRLKPGDPYPVKCPTCGRSSVLPTALCKKCGNRQVLNERRRQLAGLEDLPPETECNQCGGRLTRND